MTDDVPEEEKLRRLKALDEMQASVLETINAKFKDQTLLKY